MEAMAETRPSWYRSFILGEWGAFEGQAYAEFEEAIHVVEPFAVPEHWERFESMDHGAANPTAWHAWAADEDGNVVVFGEHYEAGQLVSHHARRVLGFGGGGIRGGWGGQSCGLTRRRARSSGRRRGGVSRRRCGRSTRSMGSC